MPRPQTSSLTGPTYRLAEFINDRWDDQVRRTNEDVAHELGYKTGNIISMWRTGKTRIPLERLPDLARLLGLDIAVLLPLWFEQAYGDRVDVDEVKSIFDRFVTVNEMAVIKALRNADGSDPVFEPERIEAIMSAARGA